MKHKNFIISMVIITVITMISGKKFIDLRKEEKINKGEGVVGIEKLSKYAPTLKGTAGDTDIYHLKGDQPGGSILVLGGTHANEPSGYLTALMMIEHLKAEKGDIYIIPQANKSAFTHNDSQEGNETYFTIKTESGDRKFRFGSRATNPIHQWPDPDIYIHEESGQKLSGGETRNLNRAYPGKPNGTLTEKVAFGIVELIKAKNIDISVDLHEASPEYPVINAMVSHEKGMDIASSALMNMQLEGVEIGIEPSPKNLRGLSHREWGDYTNTVPFLFETANPSQGRLRGATTVENIVNGQDNYYVKLSEKGMLFVGFTKDGHPLSERVARQIVSVQSLMSAISEFYPEKEISFKNAPTYNEIITNGVGTYLK